MYPMLHFHRKFSSGITPWPHGTIAEKSSLVRKRKPHVEKSREMPITRNRTSSPAGNKNSHNITQSMMAKNRSASKTNPL